MRLLQLSLIVTTLIASTQVFAQQRPAPQPSGSWSWSGHVDHLTLDKEAAFSQGVDKTATALGFAGEYYANNSEMTLSLGMNVLLYNDNDEFVQYVRDSWGDSSYEKSDASGLMLFAEYGPKYRVGADNLTFLVVRAGASVIVASERSISDCRNCYSEDIDINGGVYGVLGVGRTLGRLDLSLQFQQYFSGDIDNSLRLKLSGAF